jgi:tetratricopeptide (TPR) repeat protein
MISRQIQNISIVFLILSGILVPTSVLARVIEDVHVQPQPDGYEIVVDFLFPVRYQSHTPPGSSKELRVNLRPVNFSKLTAQEVDLLRERFTLAWDYATGVPLQEIIFEGGDPEQPQIIMTFTEEVSFEVRGDADLRALIVSIKRKAPVTSQEEEVKTGSFPEIKTPTPIVPEEKKLADLMEEAGASIKDGQYDRAIQLYTKIINVSKGPLQQQAREFLGLAREKNGQMAHAKSEYERYLEQYPTGPDADRVRQRLAGLVTAAKLPKKPLREVKPIAKIEEKLKKWDTRVFGSLSEFYSRDQTTPEGGQTQVNRSSFNTDMDLNAQWRNQRYDMRFQATGGHEETLLKEQESENQLSNLSFEARKRESGLYGKFGRQSRNSGGVLGRFDGAHLAYDVLPRITVNSVVGFPVASSREMDIEKDKKLYGVSFDLGTFKDKWDLTTFFITQENHGFTDRRAIGTEVRYFDPKKSFFNLVDYDIFFKKLNIFLFNGQLTVLPKTVLNFILDYRQSPLLTTENAIQGQGVTDVSDLESTFSKDQIFQLAEDRAAVSKSMTAGLTHDVKEDMQWTGEVTLTEVEGTVSSGGVDASPGTGVDVAYLTQLIFSNVVLENDTVITALRYSDTANYNTYTVNLNGRFPVTRKIRLNPKVRVDFRDTKISDENRVSVRPVLRTDYQLRKWMRCEVEGGVEWVDEGASESSQTAVETFVTMGARINF